MSLAQLSKETCAEKSEPHSKSSGKIVLYPRPFEQNQIRSIFGRQKLKSPPAYGLQSSIDFQKKKMYAESTPSQI